MVELALLMPLLAMILFAVIEFGIAFQRWQVVSSAAREGARAAVLAGCDAGAAQTAIESVVHAFVSASGIPAGEVAVTVDNPCGATGTNATVTVAHNFIFPVLSSFVPGLGDGLQLQGASVMRNE